MPRHAYILISHSELRIINPHILCLFDCVPLKAKSERFFAAPKPPGKTTAIASSSCSLARLWTGDRDILARRITFEFGGLFVWFILELSSS